MKKITLRLDNPLAKKLALLAESEKRSINNYLVMLIERESQKSSGKKKSTFLAEKNIHEIHLQNYKKFKEEKLETNEKTRNEKTRNKKTN